MYVRFCLRRWNRFFVNENFCKRKRKRRLFEGRRKMEDGGWKMEEFCHAGRGKVNKFLKFIMVLRWYGEIFVILRKLIN